MKRYLPYIFTIILLITLFVGGFGNTVHAESPTLVGCAVDFNGCVVDVIATVVNTILSLTAWILALAGFMLNISMNVTLHIKEFVEGTPALYTVWRSIRDISGMFLIFLLLYAGIKMILGFDAKMKNLVTTIVMAGILINFSFFITGFGIDVSNMVSVQLYNSIAPQNNLSATTNINTVNGIKASLDGGISDIFMSALMITNIYDANTGKLTSSTIGEQSNILAAALKIILGGVFGILIILSAAVSFFIISLALIARFVILIFLLGFSPIIFAGFAIPQLNDYVKSWKDMYIGQLVFLPAYLLLMYFALTILSQSNLFQAGFAGNLSTGGEWYINFLILGVNAAFVIIMLNAPLLAALKLGAIAPDWAKNVDAFAMWKKVGGWAKSGVTVPAGAVGGVVGRNTIGWAGSKANKYFSNTKYGNSLAGRAVLAATAGKMAAGKYGGSRSYAENKKAQRDVENKNAEIDRATTLKSILNSSLVGPVNYNAVSDVFKTMNEKEKLSIGAEELMKPEILRNLKDSDFEAIKKDLDGNFTEEERNNIADQRKNVFKTAASNGDHETVKKMLDNMKDETKKSLGSTREDSLKSALTRGHTDVIKELMKDMDGKELYQIQSNNPGVGLITSINAVEHLTPSQLKKMSEEGLSIDDKRLLRNIITGWPTPHRGSPTVRDVSWLPIP